jgi:hypothetical protein
MEIFPIIFLFYFSMPLSFSGVKIVEIFSGYLIMCVLFTLINSGLMAFFQFVVYAKPYGTFWLGYLLLNVLGFTGTLFGKSFILF